MEAGTMTMRNTLIAAVLAVSGVGIAEARQQPIDPVDFRPFVDGGHWIVRQPLVYRIGVSTEQITVPVGFVTDFASIPQALQSIIKQHGLYILPAVVHDYLYWNQSCTRKQADQIFLLAMIENKVGAIHRTAIYNAVAAAGSFAWDDNARERAAGMIRILPPDRQRITAATLWPLYRQEVMVAGVSEPAHAPVAAAFCARGDMTTDEALKRP
jgi:hypothetical protein